MHLLTELFGHRNSVRIVRAGTFYRTMAWHLTQVEVIYIQKKRKTLDLGIWWCTRSLELGR